MTGNIKTSLIDLSHKLEQGMVTYHGIPGPNICDYWSREDSKSNYDDGSSFHIGRIDLVANTGTYVDSPFHRYENGCDLAQLPLESLAGLEGVTVVHPYSQGLSIDVKDLEGVDVAGKAVLFSTSWDRHWRKPAYYENHPYLTTAAAEALVERKAAFVGIDSHNIDDTRTRARPVHTILLGANIPICEHMTRLTTLPSHGFRFHAVPPKIVGLGTFPVRAYAILD